MRLIKDIKKQGRNPKRSKNSSVSKTGSLDLGNVQEKASPSSGGGSVDLDSPIESEVWFHGKLAREDLGELLQETGDCVVRFTDKGDTYAVSILWNDRTLHFKVNQDQLGYHLQADPSSEKRFKTIAELIRYYTERKEPLSANGCKILRMIPRMDWELRHRDIKLQHVLGKGEFGEVRYAILRNQSGIGPSVMNVAVKTLQGGNEPPREERLRLLKEARLMRTYQHPNIIQLHGIAVDEEPMMIVMEFAPLGALKDFLIKNKDITPIQDKNNFCLGAARGMAYLESRPEPVIHRDLAARNCLLGEGKVVKITDFGLARSGNTYQLTATRRLPVKWSPPEVLLRGQYTTKSDRWSYGVLIWEIYSDGDDPYPGMRLAETKRKICREKYRLSPPNGMPPTMAGIMAQCFNEKPELRMSFAAIVTEIEKLMSISPSAKALQREPRS